MASAAVDAAVALWQNCAVCGLCCCEDVVLCRTVAQRSHELDFEASHQRTPTTSKSVHCFILLPILMRDIAVNVWQRCDLCSRCQPKESCIGWIPEWRHLANTIKLFVLGRDADFCQMTIDTCYRHHCAKRMQRYLVCRGGGQLFGFCPPGGNLLRRWWWNLACPPCHISPHHYWIWTQRRTDQTWKTS